ncbi:hypothetical protein BH23GEM7_BH23GEM7_11290 [soil metagenome]
MQASAQETILKVARAQASAGGDPEVSQAMARVLAHGGDLSQALADLAPEQAQFFGPGKRFLESLVEETCHSLTGEGEIIAKLEEQRQSLLSNAAVGVGVGAGLISGATGLPVAIAAIVLLYLVPIGVRAGCRTWEQRERTGGGDAPTPAG